MIATPEQTKPAPTATRLSAFPKTTPYLEIKATDQYALIAVNLLATLQKANGNVLAYRHFCEVSEVFSHWLQSDTMEDLRKAEPQIRMTADMPGSDVVASLLADLHLQHNLNDTDEHDRYNAAHTAMFTWRVTYPELCAC